MLFRSYVVIDALPENRELAAGEGKPIADVRGGAIIVGVRFAEGNFQPQPPAETVLNAGDVVMAMGTLRTMQRLEALFAPARTESRS